MDYAKMTLICDDCLITKKKDCKELIAENQCNLEKIRDDKE